MAGFLAAHLAESAVGREDYAASAGFCLPHLRLLGEQCDDDTLDFLRADAARRLQSVSARLEHYRLLRDYRHRDDPRGDEQWADTDATALLARQRFPETRDTASERSGEGVGAREARDRRARWMTEQRPCKPHILFTESSLRHS